MAKLTPKQERFVEEYLIDLNATQAAIRAGYSSHTANEQGARLLTNVSIRACVDKAKAERSKRTGINQDLILQEIARIARVNIMDIVNPETAEIKSCASVDDTAAIASIKVKKVPTEYGDSIEREVKVVDKIKALELAGKHLGMFTDKLDVNHKGAVQVVYDIPRNKTD
ncbi:terminase small subunit [Pelosinus propionicus]|uniref:Phage terminase small subunit n=1 Tax=Pelosinus propionicus DSM 13327 TaxID=1123291 RepID=A0A1I4QM94_9FIRM|nr:terminase small subunit [Pelosinus propionicus]SFM41208.1 phage terminase small subunit [Pelosinus propionicus DSM 13327]